MEELTKREKRVVDAFINCVKHNEYSEDYAIILIEDNARYGWMRDVAKDAFYEALDALHPVEVPEPEEPVEPEIFEEQPEEPQNPEVPKVSEPEEPVQVEEPEAE